MSVDRKLHPLPCYGGSSVVFLEEPTTAIVHTLGPEIVGISCMYAAPLPIRGLRVETKVFCTAGLNQSELVELGRYNDPTNVGGDPDYAQARMRLELFEKLTNEERLPPCRMVYPEIA